MHVVAISRQCLQIELLSTQFTVYALDQRGHGASADGPTSSTSGISRDDGPHIAHTTAEQEAPRITKEQLKARMEGFPIPVTDVIEVVNQLGLVQPMCFGHSLGGSMALLAEVFHPGLWKQLCVFEPPITVTEEQVCFPVPAVVVLCRPGGHLLLTLAAFHTSACLHLQPTKANLPCFTVLGTRITF